MMLALSQLGKKSYEIGALMGRSHNTVAKYIKQPVFTDAKFQKLVEEYKEKEILDLTVLNIEARARLHDLVPVMTPIESIALMDKSFQQRRLLEGRSTANISTLSRIIQEAHERATELDPKAIPASEV